MSELENPIDKKPLTQFATRVSTDMATDLLDIVKRERRSISQVINLLLSEYMPVRKTMVENKLVFSNFCCESTKRILQFSTPYQDQTLFEITYDDGLVTIPQGKEIILTQADAIKLAANILTYLIEAQINAQAI